MALRHRKFTLPEGCNCSEVVIRETDGIDEQDAAMRAESRGPRGTIFGELVRASVVSVDGKKVDQPFMEMERWNSRTRKLVLQGYQELNDTKDEEDAVFLATAEDVDPPQSPQGSTDAR